MNLFKVNIKKELYGRFYYVEASSIEKAKETFVKHASENNIDISGEMIIFPSFKRIIPHDCSKIIHENGTVTKVNISHWS